MGEKSPVTSSTCFYLLSTCIKYKSPPNFEEPTKYELFFDIKWNQRVDQLRKLKENPVKCSQKGERRKIYAVLDCKTFVNQDFINDVIVISLQEKIRSFMKLFQTRLNYSEGKQFSNPQEKSNSFIMNPQNVAKNVRKFGTTSADDDPDQPAFFYLKSNEVIRISLHLTLFFGTLSKGRSKL